MLSPRRLPPLRLLTVFETVLRAGGIQRAARELNVSQPAVSQALRQLEAHIGTALLDRRVRPAELTEAGQILYRAVLDGLDRISSAIDHVRALQPGDPRSLTIAATVGTATYWLMPNLTGFHERNGDIAVSVRTTPQGLPPLLPGIDLAIRYGPGDWPDGLSQRLFRERVVPVAAPALYGRLAAGGFDLASAPLLHVDAGIGNWIEWPDYCALTGLPVQPGAGRRFTNYVQATQAALGGLGVMLGWRSNVSAFVKSGDLAELPFPAIEPEDAFYIVQPFVRRGDAAALDRLTGWLLAAGSALEA